MSLPDGYRMKLRHERVWVWGKHCNRMDSDGRRKMMSPKGGITHCTVYDEGGNVVVHTTARCRSNEPYNKTLGRTIASDRAQQLLDDLCSRDFVVPGT